MQWDHVDKQGIKEKQKYFCLQSPVHRLKRNHDKQGWRALSRDLCLFPSLWQSHESQSAEEVIQEWWGTNQNWGVLQEKVLKWFKPTLSMSSPKLKKEESDPRHLSGPQYKKKGMSPLFQSFVYILSEESVCENLLNKALKTMRLWSTPSHPYIAHILYIYIYI